MLPALDIPQKYTAHEKKTKSGKPKRAHALRRRKKRLQKNLLKARNTSDQYKISKLERELALNAYEIRECYMSKINKDEMLAISNLKSNPKSFYSYAKAHSVIKTGINLLKDSDGKLVSDSESIANTLQQHFSAVYSDPQSSNIKTPDFHSPEIIHETADREFIITEEAIVKAITEMDIQLSKWI